MASEWIDFGFACKQGVSSNDLTPKMVQNSYLMFKQLHSARPDRQWDPTADHEMLMWMLLERRNLS